MKQLIAITKEFITNVKKPIFLIGFMGCGKSTLLKNWTEKYKLKSIDLDDYIEEQESLSIAEIFQVKGPNTFREIESNSLKNLVNKEVDLIACGGGTPIYFDNLDYMLQQGTVIYLKKEPDYLSDILFPNKSTRPLIQHIDSKEELSEFIQTLLKARVPFYEQAHFHLDNY